MAVSVFDAPQRHADGTLDRGTIPLLPLTEAALRESVVGADGYADPPGGFEETFEAWHADDRGGRFLRSRSKVISIA